MSDTTTTTDSSRGDDVKARLAAAAEELKAALAEVVDQKLDELGAKIGGS